MRLNVSITFNLTGDWILKVNAVPKCVLSRSLATSPNGTFSPEPLPYPGVRCSPSPKRADLAYIEDAELDLFFFPLIAAFMADDYHFMSINYGWKRLTILYR
jgi:hypothetical protein